MAMGRRWGGPVPEGAAALFARESLAGLVADDGSGFTAGRTEFELGYGLAAFGGGFTGTPNLGVALIAGAREYRLGWRLTPTGHGGFEVNLDAIQREAANVDTTEHRVGARFTARW
jgi:hypothetical protein